MQSTWEFRFLTMGKHSSLQNSSKKNNYQIKNEIFFKTVRSNNYNVYITFSIVSS